MATMSSRPAAPAPPPEEVDRSLPDEELLTRFLEGPPPMAEASFRALVLRHGSLVLGVCRSVLGQHQDAEDAFQATFLTLAQKAGSIRDRRVLSRWLCEVATRIALRARSVNTRRKVKERQGAEMAVAPEHDITLSELRPILQEEIERLPENYRVPVILTYLEGKTNEEVASILGWPVGTVKGRLFRAREQLRERLTRRGLALSVALLALWLSPESAEAEFVPEALVDETVAAALRIAANPALVPKSPVKPTVSPRGFIWKVAIATVLVFTIAGALTFAGVSSGVNLDPRAIVQWTVLTWYRGGAPPPCHPLPAPAPAKAPQRP